jgi:DNA-binding IscR family transcriptional regulator
MEPSLKLLECFNLKTNHSPIVKSCELKDTFKQALDSFLAVLDQNTLDQVQKEPKELQKILEISSS